MKLLGYPALWVVCMTSLMLRPTHAYASDKLNFSGKYVVEQRKNTSENTLTLEVIQTDDSIEITRVKRGTKTVSHCPLDGSYGDYAGAEGVGRCKAQLKPKYLIIESDVLTPIALIQSQRPPSQERMHTTAKWQLSSDAKTLIIKSDRELLNLPAGSFSLGNMSGTVKYKRVNP